MADKELVAKGEDWARAQRERLEQVANEKAIQLRRIYNEHLEWFKTHTIESLIETRRPAKRHKAHDNTVFTPTDQVKLVQTSRHTIADDGNMEGNSMTSFNRQSLTSRSFHSPINYRSFSLTSPTANQSSNHNNNMSTQRKSMLSPTRIHHEISRASVSRRTSLLGTNPSDKKKQRSSSTSNKGKHVTRKSSISKETPAATVATNESATATATTNEPAIATVTEDESATATMNEPAIATTKEPPLATATANESSSTTKMTTSTTAHNNLDDSGQLSPQQNEQPSDKTNTNSNEAISQVDPDFKLVETPAWAEMPELERHLREQCNLDGHKIFGRMTPLVTSEVFGTVRQRHARK
ncbi:hypothetical protein K492DRAFT_211978 [Lichtheimia hyalospora FSU 10163]|nr:hypothetical protein K492DRAFT_211978 [Lichtheimia hyalospora FSU 10163]